jgi:hypothetical protein
MMVVSINEILIFEVPRIFFHLNAWKRSIKNIGIKDSPRKRGFAETSVWNN